jgi:hypothetical protein
VFALPQAIGGKTPQNAREYRILFRAASETLLMIAADPKRLGRRQKTMQYLLLIYEDEKRFATGFSESEFFEYGAFGKKHAGEIKSGQPLQPTGTAKTVRVRDGQTLTTDGPFAEPKNNSAAITRSRPTASKKQPR